jgi:predicted DNA-binding protein YlxM (UPF0122 family)
MRDYSTKKVKTQIKPSQLYPELVKMAAEFAYLSQKYETPKIASLLGISKQALQQHINKVKKEAEHGK